MRTQFSPQVPAGILNILSARFIGLSARWHNLCDIANGFWWQRNSNNPFLRAAWVISMDRTDPRWARWSGRWLDRLRSGFRRVAHSCCLA